jgi:hypothetical protein
MTDEGFETNLIAALLFGGLALAAAASMMLIGLWGSILWIGLLMAYVGIRML